jgi:hypothetical protein
MSWSRAVREWGYGPEDDPNEDLSEMNNEELKDEILLCNPDDARSEAEWVRIKRRREDALALLRDRREEESE